MTKPTRKKPKGTVWNFERGRLNAIAMAAKNGGKSRPPAPITLPKLKSME